MDRTYISCTRRPGSPAAPVDATASIRPASAATRKLEIFLGRAVGIQRPPGEIALQEVTAAIPQELALHRGFDAFGDYLNLERVREGHDRRDDGALVLVPGHVGDEGAVDLHLVHREALQVGEARVAGAEIVDGDRHAELLQAVERAQRDVAVLHRGGLGDLELEQPRRQAAVPEHPGDELHQLGVVELAGGEVYRNLQAALRADERRPAAGFAQHPFADLQDEARLLRRLAEFRRADETAMRVLPAHQGLVRHDLPALHRDDRLVVHAQLVAAERAPQVALQRQAARRP